MKRLWTKPSCVSSLKYLDLRVSVNKPVNFNAWPILRPRYIALNCYTKEGNYKYYSNSADCHCQTRSFPKNRKESTRTRVLRSERIKKLRNTIYRQRMRKTRSAREYSKKREPINKSRHRFAVFEFRSCFQRDAFTRKILFRLTALDLRGKTTVFHWLVAQLATWPCVERTEKHARHGKSYMAKKFD